MLGFLEEAASYIIENYEGRLDQLTVVLPNKRAAVYLNQALVELHPSPVFPLPAISTTLDLAAEATGLEREDPLPLLLELFEIYKEFVPTKESFAQFHYWGGIVLGEFEEIDRNLAPARDIFRLVADYQEISKRFVDFLEEEQIALLKQFVEVVQGQETKKDNFFVTQFSRYADIYAAFRESCLSKGRAYQGLMLRTWAEQMKRSYHWSGEYLFLGFNYLNKAEQEIIQSCIKAGKGTIRYDFDRYYLDNPIQEAGIFFRQLQKTAHLKGNLDEPKDFLRTYQKEIHVVKVPLEVGQAKAIGTLLSSHDVDPSKAAIILPRKSILFPLLHALPEEIGKYNVTLSFPLRQTAAFRLVKSFVALLETMRVGKNEVWFYHQPLLAILESGFFSRLVDDQTRALMASIRKSNSLYTLGSRLLKTNENLRYFFPTTLPENPLVFLQDVLEKLFQNMEEDTGKLPLEADYLASFHKTLRDLTRSLEGANAEMDRGEQLKLALQYLKEASTPFVGDPLTGLQITGLLESVNLSFETVIIPDMNEDSFPAQPKAYSLLPYAIRRAYGLPTSEDNDAQFAWLFYRLIQRAKKVYLLANNVNADNKKAEPSRYIKQLEYEKPNSILITHWTVDDKAASFVAKAVQAEATHETASILKKRLAPMEGSSKGLSPSALNTWLDCQLKYYFRYVAGMEEPEDLSEELEFNTIGLLFHEVMESVYKAARESKIPLDEAYIEKERSYLNDYLDQAYLRVCTPFAQEQVVKWEGKNLLIRKRILTWANNQLDYDKIFAAGHVIAGLEERVARTLEVDSNGERISVSLHGIIDRVDYDPVEDEYYLIDYKTGTASGSYKDLSELFEPNKDKRPKQVLQVLLYAWMYQSREGVAGKTLKGALMESKLLPLYIDMKNTPFVRCTSKSELSTNGYLEDLSVEFEDLEAHLRQEIVEILKEKGHFRQTEQEKICTSCPYNVICHRYKAS